MFASQLNAADYLKGVLHTAEMIAGDLGELAPSLVPSDVAVQVAGVTWGLSACMVPQSQFSGKGIKVAVLDTGFDLGHPEFAGRAFVTNSFVGQPVQDLHGHGTHTTGTACGPQAPAGPIQRYGIGFGTQIFAGKVLTNSGAGTQAQVLAGMNWAIANKCAVISMSLGAQIPVQPSYTAAGAAALAAGCLIIAAAGNASSRPGVINPAGAPANSPTILSVAALDSSLRVAVFSNGGKVDIAGPGVSVFSSWPRPTLHNTISGTSMATPHVAGCAALWAQSNPALRGAALRAKLVATARHLPFPASDVGAGLVQAPVASRQVDRAGQFPARFNLPPTGDPDFRDAHRTGHIHHRTACRECEAAAAGVGPHPNGGAFGLWGPGAVSSFHGGQRPRRPDSLTDSVWAVPTR
jgi:subtilisin